jgi:3-oxoacyl-[acyl-carrier-protein] synthase II
METRAIKAVFGDRAHGIPVSAIKSMIGESFSASGALAVAAALGVLNRDAVPPTVNYREKDPACDLDYVPDESRQMKVNTTLVLAADPYGNNSAVILGKYH